jgi:hypothetical protein
MVNREDKGINWWLKGATITKRAMSPARSDDDVARAAEGLLVTLLMRRRALHCTHIDADKYHTTFMSRTTLTFIFLVSHPRANEVTHHVLCRCRDYCRVHVPKA